MEPLKDLGALKGILRRLEGSESRDGTQESPDEVLVSMLAATTWGGHAGIPDQGATEEARSILLELRRGDIVKLVGESYGLEEQEAFWFCLGLGIGCKVLIEETRGFLSTVNGQISKR